VTTHSADGRPWAKLSELKPGDKLVTDGGFTCMLDDAVKEVRQRENGDLYIECDLEGGHTLEGQVSEVNHDSLVGLWMSTDS
jgi:hypothetical protein